MWNGKYVSLDMVIEKYYRDTGLTDELNYADALEWVYEAMSKIGATIPYMDKVTDGNDQNYPPVEIVDYRGELPPDLYLIQGVREYTTKIPFRRSTYIYHTSVNKLGSETDLDLTYTTNGNYIFTSIDNGFVEIAYKAFPIDCSGKPLIPDDARYIQAMIWYLADKVSLKLWVQGKIKDIVRDYISQQWSYYAGGAKIAMVTPDYDTAESMKNMLGRLIRKSNYHSMGFKHMGDTQLYVGGFKTQNSVVNPNDTTTSLLSFTDPGQSI